MLNLIESIGFEVEKVHTGMVRHLCRMHSSGTPEPLAAFLKALGVPAIPPAAAIRAIPEHLRLDVVLVDTADADRPIVGIEFKVHSREAEVTSKTHPQPRWQTVAYREKLDANGGADAPFLFVTLGLAEYYRDVDTPRCKWVRLPDFQDAVSAASEHAPEFHQWLEVLRAESVRREEVFAGHAAPEDWRAGVAAGYRLAKIRELLRQRGATAKPYWGDTRVYLEGTGPDSILCFGNFEGTPPGLVKYAEINANGTLNVKAGFPEQWQNDSEKKATVEQLRSELRVTLEGFPLSEPTGGKWGATKTILQIDIGFDRTSTDLQPVQSLDTVADKVAAALDRLWRIDSRRGRISH